VCAVLLCGVLWLAATLPASALAPVLGSEYSLAPVIPFSNVGANAFVDGTFASAMFASLAGNRGASHELANGLAFDAQGNMFVLDNRALGFSPSYAIRHLDFTNAAVTTLSVTLPSVSGYDARPTSLCADTLSPQVRACVRACACQCACVMHDDVRPHVKPLAPIMDQWPDYLCRLIGLASFACHRTATDTVRGFQHRPNSKWRDLPHPNGYAHAHGCVQLQRWG
jgi:hypothetical protein